MKSKSVLKRIAVQVEQKINSGDFLELADRLHVTVCTINQHILFHPLSESYPEIKSKIEKAVELLAYSYQLIWDAERKFNENND